MIVILDVMKHLIKSVGYNNTYLVSEMEGYADAKALKTI